MREVEIVFWAALNTPEEIQKLIKDVREKGLQESVEKMVMQAIRSRLMMTAYYTKGEMSH